MNLDLLRMTTACILPSHSLRNTRDPSRTRPSRHPPTHKPTHKLTQTHTHTHMPTLAHIHPRTRKHTLPHPLWPHFRILLIMYRYLISASSIKSFRTESRDRETQVV